MGEKRLAREKAAMASGLTVQFIVPGNKYIFEEDKMKALKKQ